MFEVVERAKAAAAMKIGTIGAGQIGGTLTRRLRALGIRLSWPTRGDLTESQGAATTACAARICVIGRRSVSHESTIRRALARHRPERRCASCNLTLARPTLCLAGICLQIRNGLEGGSH
jgi:hypothetical protein